MNRLKRLGFGLIVLVGLCFTAPIASADWVVGMYATPPMSINGPWAYYDYAYGFASFSCTDGEYEYYVNDWWGAHYYFNCPPWILSGSLWVNASPGQPAAESFAQVISWDYFTVFVQNWGFYYCDPGMYYFPADVTLYSCGF